jgi:hypothetical protein
VANQDILYRMWIGAGYPIKSVNIRTIGSFAVNNRKNLNSRTNRGISPSGLDYAVLKFILEYTSPVNWPQGLWAQFHLAKDPYNGQYAIWRRYTNLLVDVHPPSGYQTITSVSDNIKVPLPVNGEEIDQQTPPPQSKEISSNSHKLTTAPKPRQNNNLLIFALICFVILVAGIFLITNIGKSRITSENYSIPSNICFGNCKIGQTATDGYYNRQKITINRVFYIKHPYDDPTWPSIENWHNWDWILLDISLTNTDSKNLTLYGRGELTQGWNKRLYCFPGGYGGAGVELTDFDIYAEIKPGETKNGNISCVVDPNGIKSYKFEYDFDNWYTPYPHDKGQNAVFVIDQFIPLEYNSIKSSLKGDKPF